MNSLRGPLSRTERTESARGIPRIDALDRACHATRSRSLDHTRDLDSVAVLFQTTLAPTRLGQELGCILSGQAGKSFPLVRSEKPLVGHVLEEISDLLSERLVVCRNRVPLGLSVEILGLGDMFVGRFRRHEPFRSRGLLRPRQL